jgi:hypothetical protein
VPPFFKRREGIGNVRLDVSARKLTWQHDDERDEFGVPLWARSAVEFMASASRSWSIAIAHELVSSDDVPFLNVLVRRLVDAGFLEDAPAPLGGVARVADKRSETT